VQINIAAEENRIPRILCWSFAIL